MELLLNGSVYTCTQVYEGLDSILHCACQADIKLEDITAIGDTASIPADCVFIRITGNDACIILSKNGHGLFSASRDPLQLFSYCIGGSPQPVPEEFQRGLGDIAWDLVKLLATDGAPNAVHLSFWAADDLLFSSAQGAGRPCRGLSSHVIGHVARQQLVDCFKLWFNIIDDVIIEDGRKEYMRQVNKGKVQ